MQVFLSIIGAVALVAGVVTIGYGIPINQFSFGNTLIIVGTTAAVGGLIVIALGAVASQLQRLGDVMAARLPQRLVRADGTEHAIEKAGPAPFASKSMPAPAVQEPHPVEPPPAPAPVVPPLDAPLVAAETPMLRNPERAPAVGDTSRPSAQPPAAAPSADAGQAELMRESRRPRFGFMRSSARQEPAEKSSFDRRSARPPVSPPVEEPASTPSEETHFEAAWPPESRSREAQSQRVSPARELAEDVPPKASPAEPAHTEEQPPVAILKSGVVDGMGYTLYVDGSIEAELPQGTLRFASINELRAHLEKSA